MSGQRQMYHKDFRYALENHLSHCIFCWSQMHHDDQSKFYVHKPDGQRPKPIGHKVYCKHNAMLRSILPRQGWRQNDLHVHSRYQ